MLENFLSILGLTRGKNKKVTEVSEKHFKTKKNNGFFHMFRGGGLFNQHMENSICLTVFIFESFP